MPTPRLSILTRFLFAFGALAATGTGWPTASFAQTAPATQRVLLSPLELDSPISKGAYAMSQLAVFAAPAQVAPKFGQTALVFSGEATGNGSKGDFTVSGPVPGTPQSMGLWVYLQPNANVDEVGLQFQDGEGEWLMARVPATWTGWKWVEVNFANSTLVQAYEQKDKNARADFPIQSIHVLLVGESGYPSSKNKTAHPNWKAPFESEVAQSLISPRVPFSRRLRGHRAG